MAKTAAELRREKLKNRQKQAVDTRDQKGLGKKSVLDWGKFTGKKPSDFTPTSGKNKNLIDFLPFVVTQEWYKDLRTFSGLTTGLEVGDWDYKLELPVHKGVGENNDSVVCPRLAFGQRCPRCEDLFAEYEKSEPNERVTRSLSPSWRCWYNIYDYNEEANPDGGNGVWQDVSFHCFEKEILKEADEGEETVLYSDIEMGKSVEIKAKEKKLDKSTFLEAADVEFKDRDPYTEDIVKDTVSFDALVKFHTYEEFRTMHLGLDENGNPPEKPNEEEAEKPKNDRSRRQAKETSKAKTNDWQDGDGCPNDEMLFGAPDMDSEQCKACPEIIFDKCMEMADNNKMNEEAGNAAERDPDPVKEEKESAPTTGRRRRQAR